MPATTHDSPTDCASPVRHRRERQDLIGEMNLIGIRAPLSKRRVSIRQKNDVQIHPVLRASALKTGIR